MTQYFVTASFLLLMENTFISNKTKTKIPSHPFNLIKEAVLGKNYELSFVFIGEKKMRVLNKTYRNIDKATDILSFSVGEDAGEIFICPSKAKSKTKEFERNFSNFVAFLFIHGLFHLKGMDHSSTMEKAEEKIRAKFNI
jgi:probable rRNA maturation factor